MFRDKSHSKVNSSLSETPTHEKKHSYHRSKGEKSDDSKIEKVKTGLISRLRSFATKKPAEVSNPSLPLVRKGTLPLVRGSSLRSIQSYNSVDSQSSIITSVQQRLTQFKSIWSGSRKTNGSGVVVMDKETRNLMRTNSARNPKHSIAKTQTTSPLRRAPSIEIAPVPTWKNQSSSLTELKVPEIPPKAEIKTDYGDAPFEWDDFDYVEFQDELDDDEEKKKKKDSSGIIDLAILDDDSDFDDEYYDDLDSQDSSEAEREDDEQVFSEGVMGTMPVL